MNGLLHLRCYQDLCQPTEINSATKYAEASKQTTVLGDGAAAQDGEDVTIVRAESLRRTFLEFVEDKLSGCC